MLQRVRVRVTMPPGLLGAMLLTCRFHSLCAVIGHFRYNGENGQLGHEYILVNGTTAVPYLMRAYGYQPGDADVFYSWGTSGMCLNGTSVCITFPAAPRAARVVRVCTLAPSFQSLVAQLLAPTRPLCAINFASVLLLAVTLPVF